MASQLTWWNVRLDGKLIDEVPYTKDCAKEYVLKSLIEHDGYDPRITITKAK